MSQFIPQPFFRFSYVTSSFSKISVASPTSQLVLQPFRRLTYIIAHSEPFRCFTYVTVHSPTILSLLLRHKLIFQTFHHFTYVTTYSPTLPPLYLHHNSFSNPSVASPTLQFIPQPFFRFSYVTSSSFNSPGEPPMLLLLVTLEVPRVLRVLRRHTRRPEGENTPRTENSGTTPLFVKQELATFSGSQKYILF